MTTAVDIINDAHLFAGMGDQYNPLDANSVALALRTLNRLTDSLSTEELTIYDIVEGTFNLINGTASYSIGAGQNLGARPINVERVSIVDANGVTHPVDIVGVDQWSQVIFKPAVGRPVKVYSDGNVPLANWSFWPTPSFTNDVVHAWYWNGLQNFSGLTSVLVAPPGYEMMLVTALGVALAPFHRMDITADMKAQAAEAMWNARGLNRQPKTLAVEVPAGGRSTYNIYSDSP